MSSAFRIGSIKQHKVPESHVRRLLKQVRDDDTINQLYFFNIDFSSERILQSLQKLFVRDGRRFTSLKLLSCTGNLSFVITMVLDYSNTEALVLSNCNSDALGAVNDALRTNQCLKSLKISGATFLEDRLLDGLLHNCTLLELDLDGSHISESTIQQLSKSIGSCNNRSLRILKLNGCDLEDHAMAHLILSLIDHSSLRELDLSNNHASSKTLKMVAELIERNSTIEKLSLNSLKYSEELDQMVLLKAIKCIEGNTTLTHVDISGNHLSDDAIHCLAESLTKNSTLKVLDASASQVTENGIKTFGKHLPYFKGLETLNLADNEITVEAALSLTNGLKDNRILQSLGPILDEEEYECSYIMEHFLDLNLAGRRAFQNDITLAVWPHLLARAAQAELSCGRNESALFSLLRGPALFER